MKRLETALENLDQVIQKYTSTQGFKFVPPDELLAPQQK
jgi:hypothetical protein